MDTSRLANIASVLVDELTQAGQALRNVREALNAKRADQTRTTRIEAESYLRNAPSVRFVPSWLHVIRVIGGRSLHAREVLRRLTNILDDEDLKTPQKEALIESLASDLDFFAHTVRSVKTVLDSINENGRLIASGTAELGVLYPQERFADFDAFAHEIDELNRHLRPIVEVTGDDVRPRLASLETGSFEVFLTVGTATGAIVATIVWRLLRTWKQIEEIRKLRAETKKIDIEASDLLEKHEKRQRGDSIERIHADVMAQCPSTVDEGRRNELSISVRQSISYIDTRIHLNVLFEVAPSAASLDSTESAGGPETEVKLIRERGAAMWEIQENTERRLLAEKAADGVDSGPATPGV